jgi:hypothetical protein
LSTFPLSYYTDYTDMALINAATIGTMFLITRAFEKKAVKTIKAAMPLSEKVEKQGGLYAG